VSEGSIRGSAGRNPRFFFVVSVSVARVLNPCMSFRPQKARLASLCYLYGMTRRLRRAGKKNRDNPGLFGIKNR
jgi:hypothetical protein